MASLATPTTIPSILARAKEGEGHCPRPALILVLATMLPGLTAAPGCGVVPRSKLDECHRLSQTLRSENGRLKDVALNLRAQNQDLSQRAVEDAQRLGAQDEALDRLERSVIAYQRERDELATAFEEMRRQIRLSISPRPAVGPTASAALDAIGTRPLPIPEPDAILEAEEAVAADQPGEAPPSPLSPARRVAMLQAFARERQGAGWTFDDLTGTLSASSNALFEPGTARLTPEAATVLDALSTALKPSLKDGDLVELVGRAEPIDGAVQRAGLAEDGGNAPSRALSNRFLGAARGAIVRDRLVGPGGLDPERVRLSAPPRVGETSMDRESAVWLRLTPSAALDAPDGTGR